MLYIYIILICFFIMVSAGCENLVSNTPEQAVKDYFQSANDKNCVQHLGLHSSNFKYKPGASNSEELTACQEQLENVQTLITVKIDEVTIEENRAAVKGELTMSTKNKQVVEEIIVRLVFEDDEWKLDKIIYNDEPSQPSDY